MPELHIEFDTDERGRRAYEALRDGEQRNVPVRLDEGFTVTFAQMPELWAEDEGVPKSDVATVIVSPAIPATPQSRVWSAQYR